MRTKLRSKRNPGIGPSLLLVGSIACWLLSAGCYSSVRATTTARSSLEQQLLVRSLQRAVAQLEVQRFIGRRVTLELFALTDDRAFAKAFVMTWLEEHGVKVVSDQTESDLKLKVFAYVLGVDQSSTLFGIPAFPIPVFGVPFPEIALYKSVRNRGRVEVEIYAFEGRIGTFVGKVPIGVGKARYDEYTILILISFSSSDLDEPVESQRNREDP